MKHLFGFQKLRFRLFVVVLALVLLPLQGSILAEDSYNMDVETGAATVTVNEGTNIAVSVSPDHSQLIMDLQGVFWTLPITGGTAKKITGDFDEPALPDWSPDGKRIVYQSYEGGNFHIWSMLPDGSDLRQLTSGQYDDREPTFSPDGTKIAFSSDRGGNYDIWTVDVETGNLTRRTNSQEEEYQPTWSPDGTEIAFISGKNGNLVEAINTSGNRRTLVKEDNGKISAPSWSPDGENIAYILKKGVQSHLMISGKQITQNEDVFAFPVEWLSENKFVYTADGHIKSRYLNQENSKTIPFRAQFTFEQQHYKHKEHDFDSQKARRVKGIAEPKLSPDGKQVAFVALNDLWLLEIGKEKPRSLTNDLYMELDPAWSPDGKKLAYSSDKAGSEDIYLLNLKSGKEQQLTTLPGAELHSAWSPDGTRMAFQDQAGATHTVDIDTGNVEQVIEPMTDPGPVTWGPDGNTLALAAVNKFNNKYREGTSQILTINLENGSRNYIEPIPFKSLSNRGTSGPVWSPDGKYMAFVIESQPWVMPVNKNGSPAGKPKRITNEIAESLSWSDDSDTLLFLSNGNLHLMSIKGDKSEKVPFKMTWKPEQPKGRSIIRAGKLWDGKSSDIKENVDIIIQGNRIVDVKQHNNKSHKEQYVDASELTVIPGLWDAHVHQQYEHPFYGARQGRQFLSFGITNTMSMGDFAYSATEDRESIESGVRIGPRYFLSGEVIDGSRIYYKDARPVTSLKSLNREIERTKAFDYDIVKTYVRLPNKYKAHVIKAAHNMGIPVFSHYFYPSMALGQDAPAHMTATTRLGFSRTKSSSDISYKDVVKLAGIPGNSIISTPFTASTMLEFNPGVLTDPRIKTLFTPMQYNNLKRKYENATTVNQSDVRTTLAREVNTVKAIMNTGGGVMLGSDFPHNDVGISTHLSLQAMVKYGMTPYEALRTATYFPAKTMGVADDLGTIEPGKLADLVFVKGNPLQDIKDSTNVQMVMKYGNIYTVDELISPYNQDSVDISTSDIKTLIEKFKEEGEFESDSAARSLTIRVTAVSHYEEKEQAKKVIKHMKGFKQLLEHQRENKLISEKAYNALKEDADSLIKKWQ